MAFQLEVRGPWPGNLASATCKKPQGAHFARGLHLSACLLRNDMETGTGSIFYGAVADIFISCYVLCFFVVLPGGSTPTLQNQGVSCQQGFRNNSKQLSAKTVQLFLGSRAAMNSS